MEKLYRIEELTTEGWTLMSNQDCKGGTNPNRMRAVRDGEVTYHIETGSTEHPSK